MGKKLRVAIFLSLVGAGITISLISAQEKRPIVLDRAPVRMVQDPYPTFNGIAMDSERGEVIMADDNRSSLLAYDGEFEPSDKITEERREISGPKTHLGYICTLAISPEHNELYTVDNDWKDNMTVYPLDAKGDVAPVRELNVDHGAWGIFLDRKNDEMFVTTEHVNKISVYRRTANGDDDSLRYIQGPKTGLADPHGIYVDSDSNEIFVTNHGHWRETKPGEGGTLFWGKRAVVRGARGGAAPPAPSTGRFLPPSITVYSRTASGDVAPLRTIQGPNTKLNWPLGIYLDPMNGQLVVANSGDNSILFFDKNANGDVAPIRVIKGLATAIDGPSGVLVDPKRKELWVTSWNTHISTVYPLNAEGNIAPKRVIRSAPQGTPATAGLGNPGAVAYDPKRKEILVPNWVSHPRISAFARLANGNQAPLRVLEGQATLIARTTHDLAVDSIHDEIVAPNPFAEAILIFRGGASGEEAPIRIIQGPKTKLSRNTDNVALDPIHNEIFTVQSRSSAILVFDRQAHGDVAPIRVIQGPNTKLNGPSRIAADPVNNLIAVSTGDGIVIFNRTATGDAPPLTVITGPKTGLGGEARATRVTFYPEGKKIFVAVRGGRSREGMKYGSVSVWKYEDKGDVAPWAILKTSSVTKLKDPFGGVALDPEAKEVMVMENDHPAALLVYHLPEVFQWGFSRRLSLDPIITRFEINYTSARVSLPGRSLVFGPEYLAKTREIFGHDPFPYGVEANRKFLQTTIDFSYEQGLTPGKEQVEELFAPSTRTV